MTNTLITSPKAGDVSPYVDTARRLVKKSKSANTERAYKAHWQTFSTFCGQIGASALPAAPETVVAFIARQSDAGRKASTVTAQLAAVAWAHRSASLANPCDDIRVSTTLSGMRRDAGTKPTQKTPITQDTVKLLVVDLPDDLRGKRDRAMILVGMWGAFRRSELVALDVSDVTFTRKGATIYVKSSKTDQEGAGMTKQFARMADKTICPVTALREWLRVAGHTEGALFRGITKHETLYSGHMEGGEVARIIKRACVRAGITEGELDNYAGHSLRAGFITGAAEKGAQAWQIAEQTGHKPGSRVLETYIRTAGRGALAAIGMMAKTDSD